MANLNTPAHVQYGYRARGRLGRLSTQVKHFLSSRVVQVGRDCMTALTDVRWAISVTVGLYRSNTATLENVYKNGQESSLFHVDNMRHTALPVF